MVAIDVPAVDDGPPHAVGEHMLHGAQARRTVHTQSPSEGTDDAFLIRPSADLHRRDFPHGSQKALRRALHQEDGAVGPDEPQRNPVDRHDARPPGGSWHRLWS